MPTKATRENDRYVMSRAEDRSFFAAFDYYTTKYKLIVWLVVAFLLALGFDFRTPKSFALELQAQITSNKRQVDSVIQPKIEATNERIDGMNGKLDVLLKLRCADPNITHQMAVASGLDAYCGTLLK